MDVLMEILIGLFFEAPFEMAMESKRLKTWVKTLLFCIVCGVVSVLLAIIAFVPPYIWEVAGIWAIWTLFSIIGAFIGHKRKWKNHK